MIRLKRFAVLALACAAGAAGHAVLLHTNTAQEYGAASAMCADMNDHYACGYADGLRDR